MLGFVNIIKPTGVSSGFVVNRLKHIYNEKVGHLGTLDPLASGVLPVALGKATRFFDYFLNKEKKYFALMKFGIETKTLDSEGEIVNKNVKTVSLEDLQIVCNKFIGKQLQMPPIYSAKTVNGIRAYDAAIKNIDIELKPKEIEIYSLKVKKWHQEDVFAVQIHCSSGTYVRSIIRDIAKELNTVATTVAIIRMKSGAFSLDEAVTLEEVVDFPQKYLVPINKILKFKELTLSETEAKDLFSGKEIKINIENGKYLTYYKNKEFSVVKVAEGVAKNDIYLYEGELND